MNFDSAADDGHSLAASLWHKGGFKTRPYKLRDRDVLSVRGLWDACHMRLSWCCGVSLRCFMFEDAEIDTELHARLKAAGFNPLGPQVQALSAVVSVYYAEKTSKVLQQVQEVLNRLT